MERIELVDVMRKRTREGKAIREYELTDQESWQDATGARDSEMRQGIVIGRSSVALTVLKNMISRIVKTRVTKRK
ncbi:hypothetical protein J6590_002003 [Homalodisca vitripennis]|nr:hypothetical protein J6590_002003 [Homalodisca vitripennis]